MVLTRSRYSSRMRRKPNRSRKRRGNPKSPMLWYHIKQFQPRRLCKILPRFFERVFADRISRSAGMLTEAQWAEVLQNCGLMYGWVVDQDINQIVRAPKAGTYLSSAYMYREILPYVTVTS